MAAEAGEGSSVLPVWRAVGRSSYRLAVGYPGLARREEPSRFLRSSCAALRIGERWESGWPWPIESRERLNDAADGLRCRCVSPGLILSNRRANAAIGRRGDEQENSANAVVASRRP